MSNIEPTSATPNSTETTSSPASPAAKDQGLRISLWPGLALDSLWSGLQSLRELTVTAFSLPRLLWQSSPLTKTALLTSTFIGSFFSSINGHHPQDAGALQRFYVSQASALDPLFPSDEEGLRQLDRRTRQLTQEGLAAVLAIPAEERTFQNTVVPLDRLVADYGTAAGFMVSLKYLHPEKAIRETAQDLLSKLEATAVDLFEANRPLYRALEELRERNPDMEGLDEAERYVFLKTLSDFKRAGMHLSDEEFEKACQLKKELSSLTAEFESNIVKFQTPVKASLEELAGVPASVIQSLKKEGELFSLTLDYPTVNPILDQCTVEETRKKVWLAFSHRGCPANQELLAEVVALRQELAQTLGFESFAHLDLDDAMAKDPEQAQAFIKSVVDAARPKFEKEWALITENLPESVTLTEDGKLKPWDTRFTLNKMKEKFYTVDEEKLREYFPMERTIQGLFDIYSEFFNIDLKVVESPKLWASDLRTIELRRRDENASLLGYVVVDAHPREGKFGHACCIPCIPAAQNEEEGPLPSLGVLVCNFPKPTEDKPSLLSHREVQTFFHEFGHALHGALSHSKMVSVSGTSTARDFVEMPSQILENWLMEKDILRELGAHYQTGEPIPETLIEAKIASANADSGYFMLRQMIYSQLSLQYFRDGLGDDATQTRIAIEEEYIPELATDPNSHMEASFGHLMGYGAKYYGYMWSKVFADDVYAQIKALNGLKDAEVGQRYAETILGPGGSIDANELLLRFLGREPNSDAFKQRLL